MNLANLPFQSLTHLDTPPDGLGRPIMRDEPCRIDDLQDCKTASLRVLPLSSEQHSSNTFAFASGAFTLHF